jgi:ribosomal-protein-serine acetyltransferase
MIITINNDIYLEQIESKHAYDLFDVVDNNRPYLSTWLPWVDFMEDVRFIKNFINGSTTRHEAGNEWAFVIIKHDAIIGRIGVYKIDNQNKIAEIGYWIIENEQGKGIIIAACKVLIAYCFDSLKLNRLEIKCGINNINSQRIPEKLDFIQEGIIRQGELIRHQFIDLKLYSMLKETWDTPSV